MKTEQITFKNRKEKLSGTFIFPERKMKTIPIIVTHGAGDNRLQYPLVEISRKLSSIGYTTFRFDFRGCGESKGKQEDFCITSQIEDMDSAIEFVKKSTNTVKVGIISKSLSCIPTLIVCSKRKDISFIVLLGAPFDLGKFWSEDEINAAKRKGYIFYKGFKHGYKLGKEMRDFAGKLDGVLSRINIPILLLIGEKDEKISLGEEEILFEKIVSENKKLVVIKNADHSFKNNEKNLDDLLKNISSFILK